LIDTNVDDLDEFSRDFADLRGNSG